MAAVKKKKRRLLFIIICCIFQVRGEQGEQENPLW